jgi:hypothetical protein
MNKTVARTEAEATVAEFNRMQSFLTTMARALTKNPKMTVKLTKGENLASFTDGKVIYITPYKDFHLAVPHQTRKCDIRDDHFKQTCPECARVEKLITLVFHEMAHIVWESTLEFNRYDAPRIAGATWLSDEQKDEVRHKIACDRVLNVMALAHETGKYLPMFLNALEDIRIEAAMAQVRANTPAMLAALHMEILEEGDYYQKLPANAQIIMGLLYVHASVVKPAQVLHAKIAADLEDPFVVEFLSEVHNFSNVKETYERGLELYGRLIELGYFEQPRIPDPDPDPEPEPEPAPESDPEQPEAEHEDADDAAESGEPDPSGDGDGAGESRDDDSDEAEDVGQSSSDGTGSDDVSPQGDDEGDASDASESGTGGSADEGADDTEPDEAPQAQAGEDSSGVGTGGDEAEDDESGERSQGGDEVPSDQDSDAPVRDDNDDTEGDDSSAEEQPSSSGVEDSETDGDSSESESTPVEGPGGEPTPPSFPSDDDTEPLEDERIKGAPGISDSGPGDAVEPEPEAGTDADTADAELDDGEDQEATDQDFGYRPVPAPEGTDDPDEADDEPLPDMGDSDEVEALVNAMLGHNNSRDHAPQAEAELADPLTRAEVERLAYKPVEFTSDDSNVKTLIRYVFNGSTWVDKQTGVLMPEVMRRHYAVHVKNFAMRNILPDPSIYGRALMELKLTFERNARGGIQRNLKSGKINPSVLGKRAPLGDARIFRTKSLPKKRDYVVLLHIDNSGSTSSQVDDESYSNNERILEFQKRAVYAQAELLTRLGIKFIIMAGNGNVEENPVTLDYDYTSLVFEIKTVDQPWDNAAKERLQMLPATNFNLDGHALQIAVWELMQVRATDKVLMYYTDGEMPAGNKDDELEALYRAIATAKKYGIILMGVGVQTNSPSKYGLDTVRIDSADDLSAVIAHLGRRIGLV